MCLMLSLLLCSGYVEPFTGLSRIIDMMTGSSNTASVGEDGIASDPVEAEDTKSVDFEDVGEEEEDEYEEGEEEEYADRKKKPPHHHQDHHHPPDQQHPVPLPPPKITPKNTP